MTDRGRFRVIEGRRQGEGRLQIRLLPAIGDAPALELVEGVPEGGGSGPPLLFVHGAFGAAWIWTEALMPFCLRRGRRVAAVSLRGHGGSGGRERLREWSLADYEADLRRALEAMPEPPVVVAHSLGGLLAQRLIGRVPMRALVLAASLPPEGMFLVGPRVFLTDPHIWLEAWLGSAAQIRGPIAAAGIQVLFSEGVPPERVRRYAARMTPESPRALADAHWPGPVLPAFLHRVPCLVVGGDRDRLVLPVSTARTALYHGAEHRILRGMGHFLSLDDGADECARLILDWAEHAVP